MTPRSVAFASHMTLLDISGGLATHIALSLVGIVAMIATAALLNLVSRMGDFVFVGQARGKGDGIIAATHDD